jgi:serine/threonine-protein kinase
MSSPPSTLGKYQIIREIARSNDIVYEAYDPLMNRRVALKELALPSGSTSQQKEERLKRFLREAKAAGSLAHPNIVTIYEVGEDAGRNYLVMEYLDGHTLRNELDSRGFLPPDEAIKVATSVLRALEYAHQNGVIHRDIKPENIQMLSDGRVKLTDFGIARLTFEPNLTMDGQVFGTPSYMSPEQVVGKDIDVRSDLFSVGVVLYETLVGQKPFPGDSVVAITYAITNKDPEYQPQIPHGLWQVISKAVEKSPALRYASASEMLRAVEAGMQAAPPTQTYLPTGGNNPTQMPLAQNPFLPPPPTNPQILSQPYPGGSYNSQAPPQYGYNPYQPPPQTQLPGINSNPYMPGQSPYQSGPQQTYLPDPYGGQQTYAPQLQQIPVYYPPPPRKPLLTQDQKILVNRITLAILIVGTILVGLAALLASIDVNPGSPKPTPGNSQPATGPDLTTDPSNTMRMPSQGDLDSALALLQHAETETNEPTAAQEFGDSISNFEQMASNYKQAGQKKLAQQCLDYSAEACYEWARRLEPMDRTRARTLLYKGRDDASPNSPISEEIQSEVEKLI